MLAPKGFYFFYFAAFAALLPFLVLYYEQLEFTGQQIGVLSAIFPLMMLAGAPIWGAIADASQRHKTVLLSLMGASLAMAFIVSRVTTFTALTLLVALFAFFIAPVIPLGDTAVLNILGEQRRNYGRIRVWGAVGWGLSAPLVGILTERFDLIWAFYAYMLLMAACMFNSLRLQVEASEKHKRDTNLRAFLTPTWRYCLTAAFCTGIGLTVSGNFVYLYLTELSATGLIVGLALTMATLSELPLTFYGRQLLARFQSQHLMLFALACVVLRLVLYSLFESPLLVLLVQLLHGFSFSIMWIAGVAYADEYAPAGKQATAQGLFSATMMGLGGAAGGLIAGYLYDLIGTQRMFQSIALGLLLCTLLLAFNMPYRVTATAND
ncbi:MAG: MFS transporter [Deinococcota bacterium]